MYEPVPRAAARMPACMVQRIVRRPSRLLHGLTALAEEFTCPKCRAIDEALTDGVTRSCRCGTAFQRRASHIYVWSAHEVAA